MASIKIRGIPVKVRQVRLAMGCADLPDPMVRGTIVPQCPGLAAHRHLGAMADREKGIYRIVRRASIAITHIPTGLRIVDGCDSMLVACTLIRAIAPLAPWDRPEPTKGMAPNITRDLGRRIRAERDRLNDMALWALVQEGI